MKKFLAAFLICAFGISAMASSVVYNYKASFKRIDPVYKVRTIQGEHGKQKAVTESYGVKKDTIDGFVILPICEECEGDLESSVEDFNGVGYFTRKGDKLSKKANLPFVLKTEVWAEAAIFGKNAYIVGYPENGNPSDIKQLKSAWMGLSFGFPGAGEVDPNTFIDSGLLIKQAPGEQVWYGFLGLDNYLGGYVDNAGFGTVKVVSHSEAASLGFCDADPGSSYSCQFINNVSGSTIGWAGYEGLCGNTPMWDLCSPDEERMVKYAPIAGTWSLKYNKALSGVNDDAKEDAILKKLKASAADIIEFEFEIEAQ